MFISYEIKLLLVKSYKNIPNFNKVLCYFLNTKLLNNIYLTFAYKRQILATIFKIFSVSFQ
jgi:hypothetical protein